MFIDFAGNLVNFDLVNFVAIKHVPDEIKNYQVVIGMQGYLDVCERFITEEEAEHRMGELRYKLGG